MLVDMLDGFAHWTLKQSQEELEHAYKMIDYSIKRGGQVTIGVVNSVPTAWGEPLETSDNFLLKIIMAYSILCCL